MSELNGIHSVGKSNEEHARRSAVVAALELIKADVGAGGEGSWLETHMDNLGKYADQIQAAVKPSE